MDKTIQERLRGPFNPSVYEYEYAPKGIKAEAADTIDALEAENAELREALSNIASIGNVRTNSGANANTIWAMRDAARRALGDS